MQLKIGEMIKIMAGRENKKLMEIADEVGYKRVTFYAKIKRNSWSIDDVRRLKAKYKEKLPLEDVLNGYPL